MSAQTSTFKMTPGQFEAAKVMLQQEYLIAITGSTFSESGFGTTVEGSYDGVANLIVSAHGMFAGKAMEKVQAVIDAVCSPA
jgi:uncharacterized protein YqgV (UPF0045/DUF77 family)